MRSFPNQIWLGLTLVILQFLPACGTGGDLVDDDRLARIRIGHSTKQDVLRELGEPRAVTMSNVVGEGVETWVYPMAKYASDPHTDVPPIGVTGFPISRAGRGTTQIEIGFDEKGIVRGIQETRSP